ncbi:MULTISPECIES: sensor histidine kinase [unclassified Halomonas]|uniref:sensor histidine kinase n=1 Tax=unclassified Halomonas TaxID=2609666 RepID=UPI0009903A85|nr:MULTISPECIES: ATP-binding protein [unclassified Halomonas]AQU84147.1 histidine kinase [Halomonas sp. 'Soap Lake \
MWLRVLVVASLVVLSLLGLWWLWHWQYSQAEADAQRHANNRLALYTSSLQGALERFTYLPGLLAQQPLIQAVLREPSDIFLSPVNQHLALVAERSGADAIFLMNEQGVTLASSNYDLDQSFIGHDYRFRPYFFDAMQNGSGEFFAIGSTTGEPGYFTSYAVTLSDDTGAEGVLVVKVSLEALQDDWRRAQENVILSDANGVVILSSREQWRFRHIDGLSEDALVQIDAQRQFLDRPLSPLGRRLRDDTLVIGGQGVGERFLVTSLPLSTLGWSMHYLSPVRPLYTSARNLLLAGLVTLLALLLFGLWLRERQKRQHMRDAQAKMIQQTNILLEERVQERTQALEDAQAELVQAGKLAALGTMAAGIAHELNQPLSGIRTYAANGERLLALGRLDMASDNFQRIQVLSKRLARLIEQLKLFARKGGSRDSVNLQASLDFVLELLEERFQQQQVRLERDGDWQQPLLVRGDEVRLEQLLTNLLRNALDALGNIPNGIIRLHAEVTLEQVLLTIHDNGPGLPQDVIEQMFDPFFTTKPVGEGLGLGLFISYGIVQDLGGKLSAGNHPAGGAWFRLALPRGEETSL